MKKNRLQIIYSFFLLIIFLAAQLIVFTHHHKTENTCNIKQENQNKTIHHHIHKEIINCLLCEFIKHKTIVPTYFFIGLYLSVILFFLVYELHKIAYQNLKHLKPRGPPSLLIIRN